MIISKEMILDIISSAILAPFCLSVNHPFIFFIILQGGGIILQEYDPSLLNHKVIAGWMALNITDLTLFCHWPNITRLWTILAPFGFIEDHLITFILCFLYYASTFQEDNPDLLFALMFLWMLAQYAYVLVSYWDYPSPAELDMLAEILAEEKYEEEEEDEEAEEEEEEVEEGSKEHGMWKKRMLDFVWWCFYRKVKIEEETLRLKITQLREKMERRPEMKEFVLETLEQMRRETNQKLERL